MSSRSPWTTYRDSISIDKQMSKCITYSIEMLKKEHSENMKRHWSRSKETKCACGSKRWQVNVTKLIKNKPLGLLVTTEVVCLLQIRLSPELISEYYFDPWLKLEIRIQSRWEQGYFLGKNAEVVRLGLLWVLFFIVDWFSEVPLRTLLKLIFQTGYFDCFKYGKYG